MERTFLSEAIQYIVVLAATCGIMYLVWANSKKPPTYGEDGRLHLPLTLSLHILGIFSLALALLGFFILVVSSGSLLLQGDWQNGKINFMLVMGLILTGYSLFSIYTLYLVSPSFDRKGIHYRRPWGAKHIAWKDMTKVVDSYYLGTYIKTNQGRLFILKYRAGFTSS